MAGVARLVDTDLGRAVLAGRSRKRTWSGWLWALLIGSEGSRRGAEPEMVFVRHEPEAASGGQTANLKIGEFHTRHVYGPEHLEMLRLIDTLVEDR